jgi:hypothetical protein
MNQTNTLNLFGKFSDDGRAQGESLMIFASQHKGLYYV